MMVLAGIFREVPPQEKHDGFSWYFREVPPQETYDGFSWYF